MGSISDWPTLATPVCKPNKVPQVIKHTGRENDRVVEGVRTTLVVNLNYNIKESKTMVFGCLIISNTLLDLLAFVCRALSCAKLKRNEVKASFAICVRVFIDVQKCLSSHSLI